MKGLYQKYKKSRIVQKIVHKILIIEVISLFITIILSYLILWPVLKNNAVTNALNTNNEIAALINTSITSMADSSGYIGHSKQLRDTLDQFYALPNDQNYNRVRLALHELASNMSHIHGAVLESDNQRFDSIVNLTGQDLALLSSDWYQTIKSNSYSKGYSPIYRTDPTYPTYVMAYSSNFNVGTTNYTLTIYYHVNQLINSAENLSSGLFQGFVISDYLNKAFYESEFTGNALEILDKQTILSPSYVTDSSGYYFCSNVSSSMWTVISYIDHQSLNATFWEHFLISLILCLLLCIITILLIIPAIYYCIKPIYELSETMKRSTENNFNVYSDIETDDEIGELGHIYNDMLHYLNCHIESLVQYESDQQRMKYNLLIAQIDSHFIYNTMSIINSLARKNKTEDIISINSALIKILQNCLRIQAIDVTDTVEQEIYIVDQYWVIQNMRYDNHAQLQWVVAESMKTKLIPKNLIQPLVENCLFHGLIDEETGEIYGQITISIIESGPSIIIQVADDGKGIREDMLYLLNNPGDLTDEFNERGHHIGLSNIRQRLAYIYNDKASMHITNDNGTTVTLILPAAD
ncbi:MAG: sensor histidine kinase [Lachnospiraceae bacterium]